VNQEAVKHLKELFPYLGVSLDRDEEFHQPHLFPTERMIRDSIESLTESPNRMSHEELAVAYDSEREEIEDDLEILLPKVRQVAEMIRKAKHTVVYSGAGISTSASIPGLNSLFYTSILMIETKLMMEVMIKRFSWS